MYGNLIAEMKKAKITQTRIAKLLQISNNSVSKKISGKFSFRADEMFAIQKEFFPDKTLEYLFTKN